jgi:hypothetical protein
MEEWGLLSGVKLEEIKAAVLGGQTVIWVNPDYRVICDSIGQWLVVCKGSGGCWGLTHSDKVTMNGELEEFRVLHETEECE